MRNVLDLWDSRSLIEFACLKDYTYMNDGGRHDYGLQRIGKVFCMYFNVLPRESDDVYGFCYEY